LCWLCAGCFGIIGRKIGFDTNLLIRQDVDLTLQVLNDYRIIFADMRFYFDFGGVGEGKGGLQGIRSSEIQDTTDAYLKNKWGDSVDLRVLKDYLRYGPAKKKFGCRINVERKQKI
jgi:hypothetical protein